MGCKLMIMGVVESVRNGGGNYTNVDADTRADIPHREKQFDKIMARSRKGSFRKTFGSALPLAHSPNHPARRTDVSR